MNTRHTRSFLNLFPPPDSGGRTCAAVSVNASKTFTIRENMMGPTWAFQQNHSPPSGFARLPIMNNQHFTNPAPAVPAVDDFPIAPPVGPSFWGKPFATSCHDRRSLSFHVSHVNCAQDVAFLSSFPAVPPSCIPHAPLRAHCTLGGPVHRRPHRSSHRTHRVRFSGSPIC